MQYDLPALSAAVLFLGAVLGLVFGSALGCLVRRMGRHESWLRGRSHCDACGHTLAPKDLVPVFSYVALHGRCRYCGAPIGAEAPVSEGVLGAVFAAVVWRFGLTLDTLEAFVLCCCLFCISLSDLETREIPDRFPVIAGISRAGFLLLEGAGWPGLWQSLRNGIILGGTVLLISLIMDQILKKESMGGGDIKLLFVLGLYFSLPECLLLLILACVSGLLLVPAVHRHGEVRIPFGPALSAAAVLTMLFGQQAVTWYLGLL
jgi:leader peptidase (prepilin peptidase)/N-methyltransferase